MQDMDAGTAIIGSNGEGDVSLDLDTLLGGHACIIANSGGGKSSLIRKINEVMNGRVQEIILDAEDDFYTLRERYDFVIAGGEEGDVPATLDNARDLAIAALTHGFNLIVQLNDLGADAPEFVTRFLNGLMSAPRDLWHPVLITIDELQRFASRDAGEAIPAIKDLVFRGRKRGFTALFASLRMAEIDPGIRGMVNNWMLGRNGQALDRRTMAEQLGFTAKEGREHLAAIKPRHFWAMGPAISTEALLFKVADVETTPLRTGQARVATPPPPEALRGILAGLKVDPKPEAAEAEPAGTINPGGELHDEINALREQLQQAQSNAAYWKGDRDFWKGRATERKHRIEEIARIATRDDETLADLEELVIRGYTGPIMDVEPGSPLARIAETFDVPKARPAQIIVGDEPDAYPRAGTLHEASADTGLPPRQIRLLDALAWCQRMLNTNSVERTILGFAASVSPKGSGFEKDLGAMRTAGLVDYPAKGEVALTEAGSAIATWPKKAGTKAELFERIKQKLEPRHVRILDAMWGVGAHVTRKDLATHLGVSANGSGFEKDLGRLRTLGLLDYPKAGSVCLGRVLA